ncbi:hypothetical protein BSKO_01957 [Bryopsis sp. KO-2023]|nr:hypothetical protein BSKO_01957 [Bryopsis sp. KO-2023]
MSEALFESAQALLTGYDTAISKQWREEDRRWRNEDMEWRKRERERMALDKEYMEDTRRWRGQDMEQRVLDNARLMWSRFVEKNRRAVEERAEQLKSISNLAALISGFALIAFLEFSVDIQNTPRGLVLGFGLMTALTVGLMINSMVTCSLMHASILKTGRRYVSEEDEAEFIFHSRQYAKGYRFGERPPAPARSFDIHWEQRCENEWRRAFYLFSAGIPAFLANLALAGWIKFRDAPETAIVITIIMGLSFLVFLITFFLWGSHLIGKEVDLFKGASPYSPTGLPFDWHLIPSRNKFHPVASSQDRSSPYLSTSVAPGGNDDDVVIEPLESVMEEADSENGTSQSPETGGDSSKSGLYSLDGFSGLPGPARIDEEAGGRPNGSASLNRSARTLRPGSSGISARSSQKRALQRLSSAELILGEFRRSNATSSTSSPEVSPALSSLPSHVYSAVSQTLFGSSGKSREPDSNV